MHRTGVFSDMSHCEETFGYITDFQEILHFLGGLRAPWCPSKVFEETAVEIEVLFLYCSPCQPIPAKWYKMEILMDYGFMLLFFCCPSCQTSAVWHE